MLNRFLDHIKRLDLLEDGSTVLIALSGGLDSVVMTDLFVKSGIPVAIAHCNFGLRGKSSVRDEMFSKKLAAKHGIPFHAKKFRLGGKTGKKISGIQEKARKLRYDWFEELCSGYGYGCIATAHHLDDSIETFFLNLIRGTGLKGLTGIPVKRGNIIRPMLFATRNEIERYAIDQGLKWVKDESNDSDAYQRNRIRHHLIPELVKLEPGFRGIMKKNLEQARMALDIQDLYTDGLMKEYLSSSGQHETVIALSRLKKSPHAASFLSALFYRLQLPLSFTESILKVSGSGRKFMANGRVLLINRGMLHIRKMEEKIQPDELIVDENTGQLMLDTGLLEFYKLKKNREFVPVKETGVHYLDAKKLVFPLMVRPWKAGDRFRPLGMKGSRKLSDYFTDCKLSVFEKEKCRVLLSEGQIICILGLQIDDRQKISSSTTTILKLKFHPF